MHYNDLIFELTAWDKLGVVFLMLMLLSCAFFLMVCKVTPGCWCYNHCPCKEDYDKEYTESSGYSVDLEALHPHFWQPVLQNRGSDRSGGPSDYEEYGLGISERPPTYDTINEYAFLRDSVQTPPPDYESLQQSGEATGSMSPITGMRRMFSGSRRKDQTDSLSDDSTMSSTNSMLSMPAVRNTALETELRWDDETRTLFIHLAQARNLMSQITDRKSSIYIRIQLLEIANEDKSTKASKNKSKSKTALSPDDPNKNVLKEVLTRIRREGKEVTFDERFQLTLRDDDPADHALRFIACSIDRYSQLHITGETTVSLSHVTGGYQSTLSLVLTPPPQEDKGNMTVALTYLPTSEKLSISLRDWTDVKSLKNSDDTIFFKISLIHDGCTIERRRSTAQPASTNANINESFTFDVPREHLMDICFVLNFHRRKSTDTGVVESVVGKVALGAGVDLYDAQGHWNEMVQQPRKANEWVHPLR